MVYQNGKFGFKISQISKEHNFLVNAVLQKVYIAFVLSNIEVFSYLKRSK